MSEPDIYPGLRVTVPPGSLHFLGKSGDAFTVLGHGGTLIWLVLFDSPVGWGKDRRLWWVGDHRLRAMLDAGERKENNGET